MRSDRPRPIRREMRTLVLTFVLLTVLVLTAVVTALVVYQAQYAKLLHNVTTASEFNQDFKDTIDDRMYYYVIASQYSEGLPIEEVRDAQALARELLESTTQKDSLRSVTSVLDLCQTLEEKILEIRDTAYYDQRVQQLENNIYILTALVQEYMYDYLYCEAVHLNALQNQMQRQLLAQMAAAALFLTAAACLMLHYTMHLSHQITKPIESLYSRFRQIGSGDLTPREPVAADVEEIRTLSQGLEQMVARMNELIQEATRKQARLRNTELALLQAQINPHFLYNTLDTIVWLIEAGRNQDAVEMVANLSGFFRSSLSNGDDVVALQTEVHHVQSYLQIQQARYKDILRYEMRIDPAALEARLPKLTLQPLVENALYHGIKRKRGSGCITVTAAADGPLVKIQVLDDGVGMSPERLAELRASLQSGRRIGFGLATVHERLQLLFGPDCALSVFSEEGRGTSVVISIPFRKEEPRQ